MIEIITALIVDLKCTYTMALLQGILLILKLTCKREMSLLVALVTVGANVEALAVMVLIVNIFLGQKEDRLGDT